jgi:hypothetical protein
LVANITHNLVRNTFFNVYYNPWYGLAFQDIIFTNSSSDDWNVYYLH